LQYKVLLIVAVAMALSLVVSVLALRQVYRSIGDLDRISREDFTAQTTILLAMSEFKEQVQEWKNVLLRGKDAGDMSKHWGAFEKSEKETVERIKEARSGTPNDKVRGKLEEALGLHKSAGET